MRIRLFIFTLSIFLCAMARAELKWEQTMIELHPMPADTQAVGHFKYQNTGDKPVHFRSVRTSCGCTAAQSQKDEVPPGDKGEITPPFTMAIAQARKLKTGRWRPTIPRLPPQYSLCGQSFPRNLRSSRRSFFGSKVKPPMPRRSWCAQA